MFTFSQKLRLYIILIIGHVVIGTYYFWISTFHEVNLFGLAVPAVLSASFAVYYYRRIRPNFEGRLRDHYGMVVAVSFVFQAIGLLYVPFFIIFGLKSDFFRLRQTRRQRRR